MAAVTTNLYTARTYEEAKVNYQVIEQIEEIIARKDGELIEKLPDYFYPIAWCESRLRQEVRGKIVRSHTNDVGILQINIASWNKKAESMNLNIYDRNDNIKFGIWLYEQQGLRPWAASQKCWKKLASL